MLHTNQSNSLQNVSVSPSRLRRNLSLFRQFAQSANYLGFLHSLPNPDEILREENKSVTDYKSLLYDPHVNAVVTSRRANILSREIVIEPYHNIIETALQSVDWIGLKSATLNAILYGFQPIEIVYNDGDVISVFAVNALSQDSFGFDQSGTLQIRNKPEPLPDYKFLCPRHEATFQNPYGEALLSKIYWVTEFKRNALQFWMKAASMFAIPHRVGYIPREADDADIDLMAEMLTDIVEDNVAVTRDGYRIEQLPPTTSDASNTYARLIEICNAEISKAVLGQTLTTEIGQTGSYAAAEVHSFIRREIVEYDQRLCESTITQLVRFVAELNGIDPLQFRARLIDSEQVKMNIAQRDAVLRGLGVEFTPDYITSTYGIKPEHFTIANRSQLGELA